MESLSSIIVAIAVAAMLAWLVFTNAGIAARRSAARRGWVLFANAFAALIGLILSLWVGLRLAETAAPAGRVTAILLWMVGGGLMFFGIAAFLGAFFTRPRQSDGDDARDGPRSR
jgi:hypothetical protein